MRKSEFKKNVLDEVYKLSKKDALKEKDLKHFKSLFGLILKSKEFDKMEENLVLFLNSNFSILKSYIRKEFISGLVLSTFKTDDLDKINKVLSVLYDNGYEMDYNEKGFKCNLDKIFNYAAKSNSKNETKNQMMKLLLSSSYFTWVLETFSFEKLIEPAIYKAVINRNYSMYEVITDSLNFKANHSGKNVLNKASYLALKNKDLQFFKLKYSRNDFLNYYNKSNAYDFIIESFNKSINEKDFETADFILSELNKMRVNIDGCFLLLESYYEQYGLYSVFKKIILSENKNLLDNFVNIIKDEFKIFDIHHEFDSNKNFKSSKEFIFNLMIFNKDIIKMIEFNKDKESYISKLKELYPEPKDIYRYFKQPNFKYNVFLNDIYEKSDKSFKAKVKKLNSSAIFEKCEFDI